MSEYECPKLEIPDLIGFFRDIECDVNEQDFKEPKKERWEVFYFELLRSACGNQLDYFSQPELENAAKFELQPLHDTGVYTIHFFKAFQYLANSCGVENFSMSDLLKPKPRRLRDICSAVVNFVRYRDTFYHQALEKRSEFEAKQQRKKELQRRRHELRERIEQLQQKKVNTESQMAVIKQQTAHFAKEIQETKAAAEDMKKQVQEAHFANLEKSSKALQYEAKAKKVYLREKQQQLIEKQEQLKDHEELQEVLKFFSEEEKKQKEGDQNAIQLTKQIALLKEEGQDLKSKLRQHEIVLKKKEEQFAAKRFHLDTKIKSLEKAAVDNQEILLNSAENPDQSEKAKLMKEREEMRREQAQFRVEHKTNMQKLADRIDRLLRAVDQYHDGLASVFKPGIEDMRAKLQELFKGLQ